MPSRREHVDRDLREIVPVVVTGAAPPAERLGCATRELEIDEALRGVGRESRGVEVLDQSRDPARLAGMLEVRFPGLAK